MSHVLKYFLLVFFALSVHAVSAQTVIINEVMASNATTIADEDGDYEDWIEIYNYGNDAINLAGFGLSDDYEEPFRWYFPDVALDPGDFLIVWASGKNRKDPEAPLHTSFSISSAGEEVLLTAPDDTRIDELSPRFIPTDVSAGRIPGDLSTWYLFDQPTPGAPNDTEPMHGLLSPPTFSHQSGFYSDEFHLTLASETEGVAIYFTLDGSVPDPENLDGKTFSYKNNYPGNPEDPFGEMLERSFQTFLYEAAIPILDQTGHPNPIYNINTTFTATPFLPQGDVMHGMIVRAKAFKEGYLPSSVATKSFFVGDAIEQRFKLPVLSVSLPDSSLFDYYRGIYTAGQLFDEWREYNPDTEIWPGAPANWNNSGDEWEKAIHLALFDQNGDLELDQNFGLRIHGGWSRSNPKKSFRLYARNIYDVDNIINYPFFPDDGRRLDGEPVTEFKRVLLRAGGNDSDMLRDATAARIMQNSHVGVQRTRPAVHFVNGAYWGLINIRDRQDRYHIAYEYDIDPDNVIILDAPYDHITESQLEEGIPEDIELFNDFFDFVVSQDMADEDNFRALQEMIEIDSYLDYYLMFIHLSANDWGGQDYPGAKHFRFWRVRETSLKPYQDGKWRVMVWDFDGHFSNFNREVLTEVMDSANKPSRLLLNIMENDIFRNLFINRFADLMNTNFLPEFILETIEEMLEPILSEIPYESARWNHNPTPGYGVMRSFARDRPSVQRAEILEVFNLPDTSFVTLKADPSAGHIRINTINISAGTPGVENPADWTGIYFHGVPLELEAVPAPGMMFSHWEGLPEGTPPRATVMLEEDISITAHFKNAIVHYWHFNDLPSANYYLTVDADHTVFPGEARITYPGTGPGYMDRTDGTNLNSQMGAEAGYGLRVRNPSDTRSLVFKVPTTGFDDLEFSYAVHRTANGAREQALCYSPDGGQNWKSIARDIPVTGEYRVHSFDLSGYDGINNNPDLQLRITFTDEAAGNSSGNNRFDNVVIKIPTLQIDTFSPPPAIVERPYEHSLSAKKGNDPYRYRLISGSLPPGLSLSEAGLISGKPVETGTYAFQVEVTDQDEYFDCHTFVITVYEPSLLHYWHFNDLPDHEIDTVATDFSVREMGALYYFGAGDGYMDRTEGTVMNAWEGVIAGHGLRVRNPSAIRQLRFRVPSTGHQYLTFSFAVHRTNNGAQWHQLQYTFDQGQNWHDISEPYRITTDYTVRTFDLSGYPETWDQPELMLRVLFQGPEAANQSGNNRFDNIALYGITKPIDLEDDDLFVFPNPVRDGVINMLRPHTIRIYDRTGRKVFAAEDVMTVELPGLSPGVYFVISNDGKYAKVIIL